MSYPPISQGNDFEIKKKQHILTNRIIKNFSINKRVKVAFLPNWEIEDKRYDWGGSSVHRNWNHKAEVVAHYYEKGLHDKIDRALREKVFRSHKQATDYFVIWSVKSKLAKHFLPDLPLEGVTADLNLGQRELEILESKGMSAVVDKNGQANSRGIDRTHIEMMMLIDSTLPAIRDTKWQLVVAAPDSFVAPMFAPEKAIIPISHDMVLCGFDSHEKHKPVFISQEEDVDRLNVEMAKNEERWLIAQSRKPLDRLSHLLDFEGQP